MTIELTQVEIDPSTIRFEVANAGSPCRFQVGLDLIQALAEYDSLEGEFEARIVDVFAEKEYVLRNIAEKLIVRGAPTNCPILITKDDLH